MSKNSKSWQPSVKRADAKNSMQKCCKNAVITVLY